MPLHTRPSDATASAILSQEPLTPGQLAEIARHFAERTALWRPSVQFNSPERWYGRLERTPEYEVWLLTWLPGQSTEIHDHGGSCGAFAVVDGELTERAFPGISLPSRPRPWTLPAGSIRAFGPRHFHEVANRGVRPAVSVHAYSPALARMSYYRHGPDGRLRLHRTDAVN